MCVQIIVKTHLSYPTRKLSLRTANHKHSEARSHIYTSSLLYIHALWGQGMPLTLIIGYMQ